MAEDQTIDTERPLDLDYFHQEENTDTATVISFLQEYNKVGGLFVNWYRLQDPNAGMDPVFLEKADKKWCRPIPIKAVFQYLEEMIENQRYGIQILDEVNLIIEKTYWTEITKVAMPRIGDLFYIEHVKLMFEVVNVVDSDANFWGNKLTWKMTAKTWREDSADADVTNDVTEPGWAPDEIAEAVEQGGASGWIGDPQPGQVVAGIEAKCEELHTYKPGENPFGNYAWLPFAFLSWEIFSKIFKGFIV
jgi:hypothetical protein